MTKMGDGGVLLGGRVFSSLRRSRYVCYEVGGGGGRWRWRPRRQEGIVCEKEGME